MVNEWVVERLMPLARRLVGSEIADDAAQATARAWGKEVKGNFWNIALFRTRLEQVIKEGLQRGGLVDLDCSPEASENLMMSGGGVGKSFIEAAHKSHVQLPAGPLHSTTTTSTALFGDPTKGEPNLIYGSQPQQLQ